MTTTATASPFRARALACLRDGRVTVLALQRDTDGVNCRVLARVRSSRDGHPYRVEFRDDGWLCDCAAGRRDEPCAHTEAVRLVTRSEVVQ